MPITPIPVSQLPLRAQPRTHTLSGSSISDALPGRFHGPAPKEVTHLPQGQTMNVPANTVVHLLYGDTSTHRPAWVSHHCADKATIHGPALFAVESSAAMGKRLGVHVSRGSITRGILFQRTLTMGAISGLLLIMHGLMSKLGQSVANTPTPTLSPTADAQTRAIAQMAIDSNKSLGSLADTMVMMMGVGGIALLGLLVLLNLLTLFSRGHNSGSLWLPFPGHVATLIGATDHTQKSTHQSPSDLAVRAAPAFSDGLLHNTAPSSRILAERALRGVDGEIPSDVVHSIPDGEKMAIPAGSRVSYWVPRTGDRHPTEAHWEHVHSLSSGFVYGPAVVGIQPAPVPGFWAFFHNLREGGKGGTFAHAGMIVMATSLVLGIIGGLIALGPQDTNNITHGLATAAALIGIGGAVSLGLIRLGFRHKAVQVNLDRRASA